MQTAADQVNSSELKDTVRALSTDDENYKRLLEMQQDFINSNSKELLLNLESADPISIDDQNIELLRQLQQSKRYYK